MANITVPPVQISNPDYSLITNIQRPPIIDVGAGFNETFAAGQERRLQREQQQQQFQAEREFKEKQLAQQHEEWIAELGIKQDALTAQASKLSQQADRKDLEEMGTISTTILMADPTQKNQLYQQAKAYAAQKGTDISSWPDTFGPQADQLLKGFSVLSGEALRIGGKGRAPAATVTTPEGTQVQVGGEQGAAAGALGIFPGQEQQQISQPALIDKQKQENAAIKQSYEDSLAASSEQQSAQNAQSSLEFLAKENVALGPQSGNASGIYHGAKESLLQNPRSAEINKALKVLDSYGAQQKGRLRKTVIGTGPMSDAEQKILQEVVPSRSSTIEQNRALLSLGNAERARVIELNKFLTAYRGKHGTLDGAAGQWQAFADENPIIKDQNKLTLNTANIGGWEPYLEKGFAKGNVYVAPNGVRGDIKQLDEAASKAGMTRSEFIKKYNLSPTHKPSKQEEPTKPKEEPLNGQLQSNNLPLDEPKVKKVAAKQINTAYQLASSYLGKSERDDKIMLATTFHRMLGSPIDPRKVPWCAAFVNSVEKAAGRKGTGSLAAKSFLNYGTPTKLPTQGDIVVLNSPSRGSAFGHVGFFAGFTDNGRSVKILGGNQNDKVSIKKYPVALVAGYRTVPSAGALQLAFSDSR